ncbi:MAG: hypothetical protein A2039_07245 [Candidatus Melainabacteria bacterium GWA2_34_9]|nr:MAG: hypothetical protein A2039_07245 [Candidatus Melainabacteria bacterium GWA2_34_9]
MNYRRWYDRDPILSKAMRILETSDDKFQIQVALNLIKVIIEHNIETNTFNTVEDILTAVQEGRCEKGNERWYDIDLTLKTSVQMLENCSEEMQSKIARSIAELISDKLENSYDDDEELDEDDEE